MEKQKFKYFLKCFITFILGVSFLVGSFFLGAYYERTKSKVVSASANNYLTSVGNSTDYEHTADLYPCSNIQLTNGDDYWEFVPEHNYFLPVTYAYGGWLFDIAEIYNQHTLNTTYNEPVYDENVTDVGYYTERTDFEGSLFPLSYENSSFFDKVMSLPQDDLNAGWYTSQYSFRNQNYFEDRFNVVFTFNDIVIPTYFDSSGNVTDGYFRFAFGIPGLSTLYDIDEIWYTARGFFYTTDSDSLIRYELTNEELGSYSPGDTFDFIAYYISSLYSEYPSDGYLFVHLEIDVAYVLSSDYEEEFIYLMYYGSTINPIYSFSNTSVYLDYFDLGKTTTVIVPGGDLAPTDWLGNTIKGVFDVELFDGMTLGGLFLIIISVPIIIWILKLFAGG